ncbi:MAG: rhomboid family GlyGly-CTERM serine protease [Cellvibrionaceae bacterium]|jgi:rhomboid family GlyGly-CTERM serine protease
MGTARTKFLSAAAFFYFLWVLQSYSGLLEFNRQQILSGEVWRLWTGHLVHTDSLHFSLNIVAALIIYFTFFTGTKFGELLVCSFVFATLISITLLCIYPSLVWYNGLSGLLHALAAYFSMRLARDEGRMFWVGLAIVWGKVLIEAVRAHFGYESPIGDMTVITEAHFIGAFFGTTTAIICMTYLRGKGNPEHN